MLSPEDCERLTKAIIAAFEYRFRSIEKEINNLTVEAADDHKRLVKLEDLLAPQVMVSEIVIAGTKYKVMK